MIRRSLTPSAFVAAFAMSAATTAQAEAIDPISTEAIYACAEITDNAARLACYDDTVGRFQTAEEAGEVATITKSEMAEIQEDSFGFSLPSLPRIVMPKFGGGEDTAPDRVEFAVSNISRLRSDKVRITLENGQVWDQIDTKRVRYSKKVGVESAEIRKASLGSFKMKLDGGTAFRVTRVK
ncbi:MAG: hypothetical protein AAGL90_09070 [Pseudomonadota bacterium]